MSKKRKEPVPAEATSTLRQTLADELRMGPTGFDELRREYRLSARRLEDELGHLARSLEHTGETLVIDPARCRACDFEFTVDRKRPTHAPGRCPKCKRERIAAPRFSIE
jgi:transcriptional regulator